jgi:hypothetical protein
MIDNNFADTTKKLLSLFIVENIDYRKRCLHLQEIIALGKEDDVWRRALAAFFDSPVNRFSPKDFSTN